MNIDVPLREIGPVDSSALADSILAAPKEAWREELHRQQSYDVHKQTESIVLVFTELEDWPNITIKKEPGWDRLIDVALPVMYGIIEQHYPRGGTIIRAMAAKLPPGAKITSHKDSHPSFACGHRIHVPITTNPRVRFIIDGRPYRLQVGHAYEINNQMTHGVLNKSTEDRITFIFDYVPPRKLEEVQRHARKSMSA
jgi:hypothetical protein